MNKCKLQTRCMSIFRRGYLATIIQPRLYTLYDVLQIGVNSSAKEIRWAFIKLSKRFHPDRCKIPSRHDTDEFIKICEAYKTLSKPTTRRLYDKKLKAQRDLHVPLDLGDWQPNLQRRWEKYQAEIRKKQVIVRIWRSGVLTSAHQRSAALAARGMPEKPNSSQLVVMPLVEPDGFLQRLERLLNRIWNEAHDMWTHWNAWTSLITTCFSLITLVAFCNLVKHLRKARPIRCERS